MKQPKLVFKGVLEPLVDPEKSLYDRSSGSRFGFMSIQLRNRIFLRLSHALQYPERRFFSLHALGADGAAIGDVGHDIPFQNVHTRHAAHA